MRRFLVERKWPVLKTWVTIIVSPDLRDLNYSKFVEQGEEKLLIQRTIILIIPNVWISKE